MKFIATNSKLAVLFITAILLATVGYFEYNSNDSQTVQSLKANKKKKTKKSLLVNGVKYDGPEKFAYYLSALHAGQEDLDAPLRHPQYKDFYKQIELQKARDFKLKNQSKFKNKAAATFTERGPANVPGRTRAIIVDPDDVTQQTLFAGNVSGGIWKTTDGGTTWTDIAPDLDNMAIVTMAMAESNSSVIYAGTGEGFIYNGTLILNGEGIYKSTDKGVTWNLLSSTLTEDFRNVSRIIIDPTDENILLAGTGGRKILANGAIPTGAIMRSTDGGTSWTKVYDATGIIQQIIAAPSDFDVQYASIAGGNGVVKSTDAGQTWSEVNTGLNLSGRIELAVSGSDANKVYGSALGGNSGVGSDLYLTIDGGAEWKSVDVKNGLDNVDFLGGQGWYDNTILINPFDDNKVYFGGVGLFHIELNPSTDTETTYGAIMSTVVDPYSGIDGKNNSVHPDQQYMTAMITDVGNEEFKILLGNDGGIYITDAGTDPGIAQGTWLRISDTYNTTQFYGADKITGVERYGGGAQDNGTWLSQSGETASITSEYDFLIGGDGFEFVAHYTDPLKFIGGSQFNGFAATDDGGVTFYDATSGLGGNGAFVSRLSSSFQDPDVLYTTESSGVYKSIDFGRSWKEIPISGNWGFWSGSDVEVSKADPRIVWAGGKMDNTGSIFVSTDAGESFTAVPNFGFIGTCSGIYSHPTKDSTAFALFSVADSPKILRTDDLGQNWVDISGWESGSSTTGYPNVATFAVQAMPYNDDVIWAGTEIGIFETTDGGANWVILDDFPSVTVWDFVIKDGQLVIATHGRGIWTADIPELVGFTAPTVTTFVPYLESTSQSLTDYVASFSLNLRSEYDSTLILIDDVKVDKLNANIAGSIEDLELDFSAVGDYVVKAISYKDEVPYSSASISLSFSEIIPAVDSYVNDFENNDNDSDFKLDIRWRINIPSGTGFTRALNTVHPYPTADDLGLSEIDFISELKIPIIVADANAVIKFNEIVLVEEGENGSVFGESAFYDYVIVEGTSDGVNWLPLLDGYDSDANPVWSGSATTATASLYKEREINLHDVFTAGDVVKLRFRLFSDFGANAWGWGIDELEIQPEDVDGDGYPAGVDCDDNNAAINPDATEILDNDVDENCDGEVLVTAVEDEIDSETLLFPNPAISEINLVLSQKFTGSTKLEIIDMKGQLRKVKSIDPANGVTKVDLANLSKGIYIIKLSDKSHSVLRKIIVK